MLEYRFIKDNLLAVKANIKERGMSADADLVVELYNKRNTLIQELEAKRKARNDNAQSMKAKLSPDERQLLIQEGKGLKDAIGQLEEQLTIQEIDLHREAMKIPNMAHPSAPLGLGDDCNTEVKRVGTIPVFDFPVKDHVEIGTLLDIVDFDTATRVSGTKFYFLKNEGVFLELGLIRYALDKLQAKGFTPFITPDIAREEVLEGIGFNPRGEESNIYTIEGTGTCLVGTAEITLGGYYADQIVDKENLPIRMAGLSHCFRREAGAHGQYAKGLYRVHQFTKVEMFVLSTPDQSDAIHDELRAIEEEIFSDLGIPYRVVDTCRGDLGASAYRKWDLEAWMPGRGDGEWGEVTSTSNCTDFQSRRLNVRYREDGKTAHVHMLNGTAIAISRAIIAILENFQQADGSVLIPTKLQHYTGFGEIKRRR